MKEKSAHVARLHLVEASAYGCRGRRSISQRRSGSAPLTCAAGSSSSLRNALACAVGCMGALRSLRRQAGRQTRLRSMCPMQLLCLA